MDERLKLVLGAVAVASVVASATTFALVGVLGDPGGAAPPGPSSAAAADPGEAPGNVPGNVPGNGTGNGTGPGAGNGTAPGSIPPAQPSPDAPEDPAPLWVLAASAAPPGMQGQPGTVAALLHKWRGDANLSARNGSIPVELAAVGWSAADLAPRGNGTILEAMNAQFQASPPLALVRGLVSRHGDAVELTVPLEGNVTSVVLHAPASAEFLVVDWPSGRSYAWSEPDRGWVEVTQGPRILARPEAWG